LQSSISDAAKREAKAKKMHLTWVGWWVWRFSMVQIIYRSMVSSLLGLKQI
jgi:hypothetical protein